MASIITPQTAAANSTDFTISSASTTLCLSGSVRPFGSVLVQRLVGSDYITVGVLTDSEPAQVLSATGTFRVSKGQSTTATGVDRD